MSGVAVFGKKHADAKQNQNKRPPDSQQLKNIDLDQIQVMCQENGSDQHQYNSAKCLSYASFK
ncbi:MAG: hypothetical protein V4447_06555 [Pseudomonadota bacterium]